MDITVTYPAPGQIHFQSDFLFADPANALCQEFVRRMTESPAVTGITIHSRKEPRRKRTPHLPALAQVHYCVKSRTREQAVEELYERLLGGTPGNYFYDASPAQT